MILFICSLFFLGYVLLVQISHINKALLEIFLETRW